MRLPLIAALVAFGLKPSRPAKSKRRATRRPIVEQLEDRRMMAVKLHDPGTLVSDGDEQPFHDSDDVVGDTAVTYACQSCDGTLLGQSDAASSSNSPAAISPSGTTYGTGDVQLKLPALVSASASDLGTIFGQSLLYSNNFYEQSGAGASLYLTDFFPDGLDLKSFSTGMFGSGMDSAQLPQLFDASGRWDSTGSGTYSGAWPMDESGNFVGSGADLGGAKIIAIDGSFGVTFDQQSDGSYVAEYGNHDTLSFADGQYTLVSNGDTLLFHDFSFNPNEYKTFDTSGTLPAMPADQRVLGQLLSVQDAAGNKATAHYDSSTFQLTSVTLTAAGSPTTVLDEYDYHYLAGDDPNAGKVDNVSLKRGGTLIQQIAYSYYDGSYGYGPGDTSPSGPEQFGNLGDLMLAKVEDASATVLDTSYFRYYTTYTGYGVSHDDLQYMLSNASFLRLAAATSDPLTADNTVVEEYADVSLGYYGGPDVWQVTLQGAGCSVCDGGLGNFSYTYDESSVDPATIDFNLWMMKTTEYLPSGSTNEVYSNFAGETLLSIHHDETTGQDWYTAYHYDSVGRLVETDAPSAVTGAAPDDTGALNLSVSTSSGLVDVTDYFTSTTATSSAAGGVIGYVQDHAVKNGTSGSVILQDSTQYCLVTAGAMTIAPVATTTLYSQPTSTLYDSSHDPTGADTTAYSYSFYSGTAWIKQVTTTLPAVSDEGSGLGSGDTTVTYLDIHGRPVWTQEATGTIDYTSFDVVTGALLEQVDDVSSSEATSLGGLPSGWSVASGSHLNLTTVNIIDSLSRGGGRESSQRTSASKRRLRSPSSIRNPTTNPPTVCRRSARRIRPRARIHGRRSGQSKPAPSGRSPGGHLDRALPRRRNDRRGLLFPAAFDVPFSQAVL
jgi:hypothetical protein